MLRATPTHFLLRYDPAAHAALVRGLCEEVTRVGVFLEQLRLVHRNLSLDNLVVVVPPVALLPLLRNPAHESGGNGHGGTGNAHGAGGGVTAGGVRVKLTGFTEARSFSRKKTMTVKLRCTNSRTLLVFRGMEHLAPEVINGCVRLCVCACD